MIEPIAAARLLRWRAPGRRPGVALASLLTFCLSCGDTDPTDEPGDPGSTSSGDASAFADLDGLIVRQALGPSGGIYVMDPRTGAMSQPVLYGPDEGMIRGVAGSPDGLHVAVQTDLGLTIGRLDNSGPTPEFVILEQNRLLTVDGFTPLHFNGNGQWVIAASRAVSVPDGEVIDCDGEQAQFAWASPDGRHVMLSCPGARLAEERVHRDGELVWRGTNGVSVGPSWNSSSVGSHRLSQDGEWVYTASGTARPLPSLHLPSATLTQLQTIGVDGASVPGSSQTSDRAGRWLEYASGGAGAFCDSNTPAVNTQGVLSDVHGVALGQSDFPTTQVPLGNLGAFFDLPADTGLWVRFLGLDESESHAWFGGHLTVREIDGNGNCWDRVYGEVRVRRVPLDGGAPDDGAWAQGELVCPASASVPRAPWDGVSDFVALPGDAMVCGGALSQPGVVIEGLEARELLWPATLYSPGRRVAISVNTPPGDALAIRVKAVCLERLDAAGVGYCYDDGIADSWVEMDFWGGWAAPGAGGFAGPAIYAVSHEAAQPGTEVTVFGAGLDGSEVLSIGNRRLSRGEIRERTANRIVFAMPGDAPTEPAELTVEGGPDVYAHTLYRETAAWAPGYDVPERMTAPYGTLLIPISPAPPQDAGIAFYTGTGVDPSSAGRVTPEGIEITLAETVPPEEYWVHITLGDETHAIVLDVDGSVQEGSDGWIRRDFGLSTIDYTLGAQVVEADGGVGFAGNPVPRVLLADGTHAEIADGPSMFEGQWAYGPFDPFVVTSDWRMRQLVGWAGGSVRSAEWRDYPPLHERIVDDIATSEYSWSFGVAPDAGKGLVLVVYRDDVCEFGLCTRIWSFDLVTGVPTLVEEGISVLYAFDQVRTTVAGLHAASSGEAFTFSSGNADFGALQGDLLVEGDAQLNVLPTTWGFVALHPTNHRAYVADRANPGAGFVDLQLEGVGTLGTSRDGTIALFGLADGSAFMLSEASPATPVALDTLPNWEGSIESLGRSWITATQAGLVLWVIQAGNPILYTRPLPE